MKKMICLLLTAALLLSLGAVTALGQEISEEPVTRDPGWCGADVRWTYENGVLTLEGSGATDDFYAGQPWAQYQSEIRELQLKGSITYVGAYAFPDYDALETVDFGESLTEIGQGAFSGCDGLSSVSLPRTFRIFGEESFSHCKNLKEFHFQGGFPKFKLNCMWDTWAKLIYPAQRPWPLEHIRQLEEAFQGRIEFIDSDGVDHYVPEDAETPTEAPTEAPTEKPTEAPATEASTEPSYVVLPDPEEPEAEENGGFLSLPVIGLIALMVISGGGVIFMLGRMSGSRKKDFAGDFSEILLEDERKTQRKKKPTTAQKTAAKKAPRKSSSRGGKYSK